ncbi:hypothetical protein M405DRAFT_771606, partial [Rhizopogon salebrosus TDB-379]
MHSEDILGDSGRSREDTGLCRSTTVTILDSLDANFLDSCIERQPDIFLTEMQDQLREICGVDISISTISSTIRRRGFTRKKIHP